MPRHPSANSTPAPSYLQRSRAAMAGRPVPTSNSYPAGFVPVLRTCRHSRSAPHSKRAGARPSAPKVRWRLSHRSHLLSQERTRISPPGAASACAGVRPSNSAIGRSTQVSMGSPSRRCGSSSSGTSSSSRSLRTTAIARRLDTPTGADIAWPDVDFRGPAVCTRPALRRQLTR
jgi:hypothetical protein